MKLAIRACSACAIMLLACSSSGATSSESVVATAFTSTTSNSHDFTFECTIDFKLYDPLALDSVYFAVESSPLTCTSPIPDVSATWVFNPADGLRVEGFPAEFHGPATIATCVREYDHFDCPPLLEELLVTVYDAQGPDGPLVEPPSICAQSVNCTLWPCIQQGPFVADLCGDPDRSGTILASDALFTLNAAVSLANCAATLCDADRSGSVTAVDALAVLRVAVQLETELLCPAPCQTGATRRPRVVGEIPPQDSREHFPQMG